MASGKMVVVLSLEELQRMLLKKKKLKKSHASSSTEPVMRQDQTLKEISPS